jgi:hypothetical protein
MGMNWWNEEDKTARAGSGVRQNEIVDDLFSSAAELAAII